MPIEIRTFRNTDSKSVAAVRTRYLTSVYGQQVCSPNESLVSWSDFVESKLFFAPATLLIASINQNVIGWIQSIHVSGYEPDRNETDTSFVKDSKPPNTLFIDSIAIDIDRIRLSDLSEESLGRDLLNATIQLARDLKVDGIIAGRCDCVPTHYMGIAPDYALVGIPEQEQAFRRLLINGGFQAKEQRKSLRLNLNEFRPTFSRDLLKIRRSSRIKSNPGASHSTWINAAALAQSDETTFELVDIKNAMPKLTCVVWRSSGRSAAANPLDFFVPERSLLGAIESSGDHHSRVRFLISEICTALKSSGAQSLSIGLRASEIDAIELLRQTGFEQFQTGEIFERNLTE